MWSWSVCLLNHHTCSLRILVFVYLLLATNDLLMSIIEPFTLSWMLNYTCLMEFGAKQDVAADGVLMSKKKKAQNCIYQKTKCSKESHIFAILVIGYEVHGESIGKDLEHEWPICGLPLQTLAANSSSFANLNAIDGQASSTYRKKSRWWEVRGAKGDKFFFVELVGNCWFLQLLLKGNRVFLNHGYHGSVIILEFPMRLVVSIVETIKVDICLGAHHCPVIFPIVILRCNEPIIFNHVLIQVRAAVIR